MRMSHAEFVQAYRAGRIGVRVNRTLAWDSLGAEPEARRFRRAERWLGWTLAVLAGAACWAWPSWWVATGALAAALLTYRALRRSPSRFLVERALKDENLFDKFIRSEVLETRDARIAYEEEEA